MKRTLKTILVIVIMVMLALPITTYAYADEIYSKYVAVGSEFVLLAPTSDNLEYTVTFDQSVLEFVKIESVYSGRDIYGGKSGKVTHKLKDNSITYNYTRGDYPENVVITFKVKSYPNNGVASVEINGLGFDNAKRSINVVKLQECPSCPVCEECNVEDKIINEKGDENNILLYAALGACGILLITVVILAVRKK